MWKEDLSPLETIPQPMGKEVGSFQIHSPKPIQTGWGRHCVARNKNGGMVDREMPLLERSEVRVTPPRVLPILPYENHGDSIVGEGDPGHRKGGDLPTCPHPACLGLWVPAIFGQKILPQLRDA